MKRLGEGAHPFTLTLTAQAPPSVQLVPAKRYYGAPIGTSYDVRCFIGMYIQHRQTYIHMYECKNTLLFLKKKKNIDKNKDLKILHFCF